MYKGFLWHIEWYPWRIRQKSHAVSCSRRINRWIVHVFAHVLPPDARTKLVLALHDAQLLIPQGNYCIQAALHILWRGLQCSYWPRTYPILVHESIWNGVGRIWWCKQYLTPSLMLLVQGIYKCLAQPKPYLICRAVTGSPTRNPTFCHFQCFSWVGSILYHPGGLKHALFLSKVAICCRRALGHYPLPKCMEEELGWA